MIFLNIIVTKRTSLFRYKKVSEAKDLSSKSKAELKSIFGYEPVTVEEDAMSAADSIPDKRKEKKKKKKRST